MKKYLTFNEQEATLKVLTTGTEKHGKEHVPRTTIRIAVTGPNTMLDMLHPRLRSAFYAKADSNTTQEPIFTEPADTVLTEKIFPQIMTLPWAYEATACTAVIPYGTRKANIEMQDSKVDGMEITLMPGGSVQLAFNIKGHPSAADVSKLYELQQRTITLTLSEPAQGDLPGTDEQAE